MSTNLHLHLNSHTRVVITVLVCICRGREDIGLLKWKWLSTSNLPGAVPSIAKDLINASDVLLFLVMLFLQ